VRLGVKSPSYLERKTSNFESCFSSTANLEESTTAIAKTVISKTPTTENSNMAAKTGSTYISESMANIIKIPTANVRFATTASWKRMSLQGDSNNRRQPKMVV